MTTTMEKAKGTAPALESRHATPLPRHQARFDEIFREMEQFWDRAWPFRFEMFTRKPDLRLHDYDWSPKVDLFEPTCPG